MNDLSNYWGGNIYIQVKIKIISRGISRNYRFKDIVSSLPLCVVFFVCAWLCTCQLLFFPSCSMHLFRGKGGKG